MSVVISVQDVGPCRKQLEVEVPAPAVDAETRRVIGDLKRSAQLPGFRKGKVPVSVIKKQFHERIEREVLERLVPRYWQQARAELKLDTLLPPEVSDLELVEGGPLTFIATVETRPEIQLGELEGLDLPDLEVEPTDKEVEEALEGIRRDLADWVVSGRPAARGDQVSGHLREVAPEGEAPHPPQAVTVEVGDPDVWEELSLALQGAVAGGEVRFDRREGETARRFTLEVTAVKERELPPLDDELAARVGDFDSVEELRQRVQERLREAKQRERRRRRQAAALEQLRQRHPVQLPRRVVEEELERLLREYVDNMRRQGIDPETARVDWEALRDQARPQAERWVHDRLLLDAVAEAREIQVGADQLQAVLAAIGSQEGTTAGDVRQRLAAGGQLDGLRAQLRRDGALASLLGESDGATGPDPEGADEEPREDPDEKT